MSENRPSIKNVAGHYDWASLSDAQISGIIGSGADSRTVRLARAALRRRAAAGSSSGTGSPTVASSKTKPMGRTLGALAALRRTRALESKTGILRADNEPREGDGPLMADLATWLHYGVPGTDGDGWRIPPRPWVEAAGEQHGPAWQDRMADTVREVLRWGWRHPVTTRPPPFPAFLRRLMAEMRGDVVRQIPFWQVPNADSTIARKGSDGPLFDTGALQQAHHSQGTDGRTTEVV